MLHYRGRVGEILSSLGIEDFDRVRVRKDRYVFEGILIPRPEILDDEHVILKLDNGYNVGINIEGAEFELVSKGERRETSVPELSYREGLPRVPLVVTGGTITSRVDYSTGAVISHERPEELLDLIPELADIANIDYVKLFAEFSENLTPDHWKEIARVVERELKRGSEGVIIAHGTDTMHYTASALAFMLRGLDKPVILVGSQRSVDRPSTDAVMNVVAAARLAAQGPIAESVIVMHSSPSDDYAYVLRGVRARKMHTSRRDAFVSVNEPPLAKVSRDSIELISNSFRRRKEGVSEVTLDDRLYDKVALVQVWPGIPSGYLSSLKAMFGGIVIAGTGLGHVPKHVIPEVRELVRDGVPVVISSQCLFGRVDLKVYETGRRLLEAGAIPAMDMLPEVSLVKLMFVLGHTQELEEIRRLMLTNLAGEIGSRIPINTFPPCWR